MTRSKQQAMMFLLGAVLVGGALGFAADRVVNDKPRNWAPRQRFYQDLELTEMQRTALDSVLDEQNCRVSAVMKPIRPLLDSIRSSGRQQMAQILTPEQQGKIEQRRQEMSRRDSVEKGRRDSIAASRKTVTSCRN